MLDTLEIEERIPDAFTVFRFSGPEGFVAIGDEEILVVEGDDGFSFEKVVRDRIEYVHVDCNEPGGRYDAEERAERATGVEAVRLKLFLQGTAVEAELDAHLGDVVEEFV